MLTFAEMMRRYAEVAGLSRWMILPVRVLTPWLSSHWVGLITPVPNHWPGHCLVHEAVCRDHAIAEYVPDPPEGLTDFDTAVRQALTRVSAGEVDAGWADGPADPLPTDPAWSGGTVHTDKRSLASRMAAAGRIAFTHLGR